MGVASLVRRVYTPLADSVSLKAFPTPGPVEVSFPSQEPCRAGLLLFHGFDQFCLLVLRKEAAEERGASKAE